MIKFDIDLSDIYDIINKTIDTNVAFGRNYQQQSFTFNRRLTSFTPSENLAQIDGGSKAIFIFFVW